MNFIRFKTSATKIVAIFPADDVLPADGVVQSGVRRHEEVHHDQEGRQGQEEEGLLLLLRSRRPPRPSRQESRRYLLHGQARRRHVRPRDVVKKKQISFQTNLFQQNLILQQKYFCF